MMKLEKKQKAEHIIKLEESLIICLNGYASGFNQKSKCYYEKLGNIASSPSNFIVKGEGYFDIYHNEPTFSEKVICENIRPNSGFIAIEKELYAILNFADGYAFTLIEKKEKLSGSKNFWGTILDRNFRLNFPKDIISNPTRFSCSDLLGAITFWEYDCGEGYIADRFYKYKKSVVFVKGGVKGALLVQIDLKSGMVIWEKQVNHGAFSFDKERGLLVSIWGNKHVGSNYQIIDLVRQNSVYGKLQSEIVFDNVNVHWQQQFLHKNKIFFSDNVNSFGDDFRPVKFGCFDLKTKQCDFLQEINIEDGIGISQVIHHKNKLYIRMAENTLLTYIATQ